ncbi:MULTISPECIES: acyl-CoA-like ligand-binding transcription factor [Streptomycetaceae]|uniref:TetR-family transcriptional regulator n=1 Tax=Streptantibioticus cattleyicolor (strain ATCC 35852 / DSM 46488 / JCM 4925 / NBRC 14057 / NRRL 8057) TaxID=1003195 RepID=F8K2C8_STREN|nr:MULTISPECIES: TetR family transcriptional regulator [Streptomycetaceae]AEW96220.1 TetR-family transcriptional regulator [Streptantibioticus cattleyicolor NRRL 8057 = DSM 46488]MYS60740.1 TetR family transcriptional regulator [Streptomyces sp. SID5468]CCB76559.1 TetR-family transcriptional regulator [Streptantibioticus cattleyicolor NRRL 8057 = DSM 46488]
MAPAPTSPAAAPTGLRERKKLKTRRAIRQAAFRLFERQGYEATTIEQIAAAAEVSPSTFFRYFPAKEDVVLTDEYDPVADELRDRPAGESPVASLRHAVVQPLRRMTADDREELLHRLRLARQIPGLRARMGEATAGSARQLVTVLAERAGRSPDDFELRVVTGALLGAWAETVLHWSECDGREDLAALVDRALEVLSGHLSR